MFWVTSLRMEQVGTLLVDICLFLLTCVSPSAEKELYEHHQEMLEKHTEKLSELTEIEATKLKEEDRAHVVNLTR